MTLPQTMKAIAITAPGGPEVLAVTSRPVPRPRENEVLIRVHAAGVNRPDVLQRQGHYPPPPGAPDIPGLEVAGEIVATGGGVDRSAIGHEVMALVAGGGYGEYCCADFSNTLPIPEGLSMEEAGSIPETFFTVWHNVFERGGLRSGESFLVHGGTSGIGTTAIQLARAFGARVFTTAGSAAKCAACVELGAEVAIPYREQDFVEICRAQTGGKGVDLILDMVGGSYIERNWDAAAPDGRIVQIAFLEGSKVTVNFSRLMMKRLTHTGSTLRARDIGFKAAIAAQLQEHVWPLLRSGTVRPVMDRVFPFHEAAAAHARMDAGQHIGKIALRMV